MGRSGPLPGRAEAAGDHTSPHFPAADLLGCPSASTGEQKQQVAGLSLSWGLSVLHTAAPGSVFVG